MKVREFKPRHLDIAGLAAAGATLEGAPACAELPRLLESCAPAEDRARRTVQWRARGETRTRQGAASEVWLHLEARARVPQTCQRCLDVVEIELAIDRWFRFCANEDEAARLDEEQEEDVLVLSRNFDLLELVEDELLMALPLVPRHERCPSALHQAAAEGGTEAPADEADPEDSQTSVAPNPFAQLAALRRKP